MAVGSLTADDEIPLRADAEPRSAFVYQEALRGLLQQQAAVESLHARAATLIFAASFVSSLLGARALEDGVGAWDWTALGLLVSIGGVAVFLLWPYYNLVPLRPRGSARALRRRPRAGVDGRDAPRARTPDQGRLG